MSWSWEMCHRLSGHNGLGEWLINCLHVRLRPSYRLAFKALRLISEMILIEHYSIAAIMNSDVLKTRASFAMGLIIDLTIALDYLDYALIRVINRSECLHEADQKSSSFSY